MNDFRERLLQLSGNLWWTWNADARFLLTAIDRDLWRSVERNPIGFLRRLSDERLADAGRDPRILAQLSRLEKAQREYLQSRDAWALEHAPAMTASPVAYFSPEFGIHESLPIYSGGLGVLAGDHLKSCSDLGVPVYGVSLLYSHGYFTQEIDASGRQQETYQELDTADAPVQRILDASGMPMTVTVPVDGAELQAELWEAPVGRCRLILLDVRASTSEDFPHALRLYGGGPETRIFQEVVLGIGGYRALRALGIEPGVIHLNEGHSAFATLEAIAERMERTGQNFADASERVANRVVFTTHTPVEAGHDRFDPGLVLHHLHPLRERLGLDEVGLLALGRVEPHNEHEPFCMTTLALKLSRKRNGVSSLHGAVSRRMWKSLWPQRRVDDVPIGHITNGVHLGSWLAPELSQLYASCLGENWRERACDPALWAGIENLRNDELWQVKMALKQRLLDHVHYLLQRRAQAIGSTDPLPELRLDRLTIGFARRFAAYKRSFLLFEDADRAKALLTDPARPVQLLIAGKAHPADEPGKAMLHRLMELGRDPELRDHIIVVPGYNVTLSRVMVQGCDLWLNNPRRPLEACGTSGMKAAMNGTLNCSTLDGWWDEAWDLRNGFTIGSRHSHADTGVQDRQDAESLHDVLNEQVVPLFYERDAAGIPAAWLERVKHALHTLAWRYNSDRMVLDYARGAYLAAAGVSTSDFR